MASISYPPIPIFELGPLNLSLHGLFAGLGFVAGAILMLREVRRRGFDAEGTTSVLTWALVASILGARFFTVPAHLGDPGYGASEIFALAGDFSILGGYAGGILGGLLRFKLLKMRALPYLDAAAAGLAIGAVVGRIGDVAIVEHLGSPTDFFLGYLLKPGYEPSPQHSVLQDLCEAGTFCGPYHPTGLYDMIGAAVLLGVIYWLARTWQTRHYGQLFAFWIIWYGFQRFLIDFARLTAARDGLVLPDGTVIDGVIADGVMGPFTGSQWGGLLASLLGVALLVYFGRTRRVVSTANDEFYGAVSSDRDADEAAADDVGDDSEKSVTPSP
ncbi:MAG: prolipoprotein diacylglyceryl transferase [bacterium]|nr:prolipoprotein diacylglyceryl transferase [bacterium]